MYNALRDIERGSYCFVRSSVPFQEYSDKKSLISSFFGICGRLLQFQYTGGYAMMHKALRGIDEVLCYFASSYVQCQRHACQRSNHFEVMIPASIRRWLGNDVQSSEGVEESCQFFKAICPISRPHRPDISSKFFR